MSNNFFTGMRYWVQIRLCALSFFTAVWLTSCDLNSSATAPAVLSSEFKDAVQYCQDQLGAKAVKTFYSYGSDEYHDHNGLNIVFRNCSLISLEGEGVSASIENTFWEILKRIPEKELPSQLTISLQEDWGFTEIYKRAQSQTYSRALIQSYHQYFHSASYSLRQRLSNLEKFEEYQAITKICDSLLNQKSHLELAHPFLGLAAYETHDSIRALVEFKKASRVDHTNSRNYENLGIVLYEMKLPEKAIPYLDTAKALDSTRVNSWYYHGLTQLEMGDTSAACADFAKAKKLGFQGDPSTFLYCP